MSNELDFSQILDLCPKSLNFYTDSSGPDLLVISSLLREFQHLHQLVKEEKVNKNEIFLFVNQDFSMSISKYVRYYNSELAKTFPIDFLPGIWTNERKHLGQRFAIICAPSTHINYFKLTAETPRQQIFRLKDSLKEEFPCITTLDNRIPAEWWLGQIKRNLSINIYEY